MKEVIGTLAIVGAMFAAAILADRFVLPARGQTVEPQAGGPVCALTPDIEKVVAELSRAQIFGGLDNGGMIMRVFLAQDGGWTLVRTSPHGVSCVVMSGQAGELAKKPETF